MHNILVLGKYATKATLSGIALQAQLQCCSTLRIIAKEGDETPDSNLIIKHVRNMMGDVCDLLWEASTLDQDKPLIITSVRGFDDLKTFPHKLSVNSLREELVSIHCSENIYAGFKFDSDGRVCESSELPAHAAYWIEFPRTAVFTDAAEEVILLHKAEKDGKFELYTVINQLILHGENIHVEPIALGDR